LVVDCGVAVVVVGIVVVVVVVQPCEMPIRELVGIALWMMMMMILGLVAWMTIMMIGSSAGIEYGSIGLYDVPYKSFL
jgi:hypothetical protein